MLREGIQLMFEKVHIISSFYLINSLIFTPVLGFFVAVYGFICNGCMGLFVAVYGFICISVWVYLYQCMALFVPVWVYLY
jgi:hypothetical protein